MHSDAEIQRALDALDQADPQKRHAAIQRLGNAQYRPAVPRLIALLKAGDPEQRAAAAAALGEIGAAEAVPALLEALRDPALLGLRAFPLAIIRIGAPAVPYLIPLLAGNDETLLAAAIYILQEIDTPEAQEALRQLPEDRRQMTTIFGLAREEALKAARELAEEAEKSADDSTVADVIEKEREQAANLPFPPLPPQEFRPDVREAAPPIPAPSVRQPVPASPSAPLADLLERNRAEPETPSPGTPAPADVDTRQIEFAAYYPKEVIPHDWQPLTAYIYKAQFAEQVEEDARKQLGILMSTMRRISEAARRLLAEGTLITATPYLNGFQFNPPSITIGLFEDWHRLNFKLRATEAPLDAATNGYLSFTVQGVIVADIPLSIFVSRTVSVGEPVRHSQSLYQAIFCSYSHKDVAIVERVERAYKALGMDFLRDVYTLKSGQDWDDQLLRLIERADIFQLFWSHTAAQSKYVRMEWEHALSLNRQDRNFIRPVYWEQPIPPVPPELSEIHFAYEPALDD